MIDKQKNYRADYSYHKTPSAALLHYSTSDRNYQAAKAYHKVNEILHLLNQRTRIEWEPGRRKYPKSVRLK